MALTVIYTAEAFDDDGVLHQFQLLKEGGVGSTAILLGNLGDGSFLKEQYGSPQADLWDSPLLNSIIQVALWPALASNESFSQSVLDDLRAINTGDPRDYALQWVYGATTMGLWWVLPQATSTSWRDDHQNVLLTCKARVKSLSKQTYPNIGDPRKASSVALVEVLNDSRPDGLATGLKDYTRWKPTALPGDPLEITVDPDRFSELSADKQVVQTFDSATVAESLARSFGGQVLYYENEFHLLHVPAHVSGATVARRSYNSAGAKTGSDTPSAKVDIPELWVEGSDAGESVEPIGTSFSTYQYGPLDLGDLVNGNFSTWDPDDIDQAVAWSYTSAPGVVFSREGTLPILNGPPGSDGGGGGGVYGLHVKGSAVPEESSDDNFATACVEFASQSAGSFASGTTGIAFSFWYGLRGSTFQGMVSVSRMYFRIKFIDGLAVTYFWTGAAWSSVATSAQKRIRPEGANDAAGAASHQLDKLGQYHREALDALPGSGIGTLSIELGEPVYPNIIPPGLADPNVHAVYDLVAIERGSGVDGGSVSITYKVIDTSVNEGLVVEQSTLNGDGPFGDAAGALKLPGGGGTVDWLYKTGASGVPHQQLLAQQPLLSARKKRRVLRLQTPNVVAGLSPITAGEFDSVRYWPAFFERSWPTGATRIYGKELREDTGVVTVTTEDKARGGLSGPGTGGTGIIVDDTPDDLANRSITLTTAIISSGSQTTASIGAVDANTWINDGVFIIRDRVTRVQALLTADGNYDGGTTLTFDANVFPFDFAEGSYVYRDEDTRTNVLTSEGGFKIDKNEGLLILASASKVNGRSIQWVDDIETPTVEYLTVWANFATLESFFESDSSDVIIRTNAPSAGGNASPSIVLSSTGSIDFNAALGANKVITLNAPATVFTGYLELSKITAPGVGATDAGNLYAKAGSLGLFWHPDGGSEVDLTSGSGGPFGDDIIPKGTGTGLQDSNWSIVDSGIMSSVAAGAQIGIGIAAPNGTLHVHTGSAGTVDVTTGNDVVVESNLDAGVTVVVPDSKIPRFILGTEADPRSVELSWNNTASLFTLGTRFVGGEVAFTVGNAMEAARFDSSGNLGIGTTLPQKMLDVFGTIRSTASGAAIQLWESDRGVDDKLFEITAQSGRLRIRALTDAGAAGGNFFDFVRLTNNIESFLGLKSGVGWFAIENDTQRVGIGTIVPAEALDVVGNIKGSGTFELDTLTLAVASGDWVFANAAAFNADIYIQEQSSIPSATLAGKVKLSAHTTTSELWGFSDANDAMGFTWFAAGVGIGSDKLVTSKSGATGNELTTAASIFTRDVGTVLWLQDTNAALEMRERSTDYASQSFHGAFYVKSSNPYFRFGTGASIDLSDPLGLGTTSVVAALAFANDKEVLRADGAGTRGAQAGTGVYVDDTGKMGVGTAGPIAKLDIAGTGVFTTSASPEYGLRVDVSGGPLNDQLKYGLFVDAETTGFANPDTVGVYGLGNHSGRQNAATITGVWGEGRYTNTSGTPGNGGTIYALRSTLLVDTSGNDDTLTTAYGLFIESAVGTGDTITNNFGVYVETPTGAGTITNKYAFVSESGAGNVGIGTIVPAVALDVLGNIIASGPIQASAGTAALPGFTFGGTVDTGVYRASGGELAFSQDGVISAFFGVIGGSPRSFRVGIGDTASGHHTYDSGSGTYTIWARKGSGSQGILDLNVDTASGVEENAIQCFGDGSVILKFNNIEKLRTLSAGGTLTGTWNATTNLQVGGVSVALQGSIDANTLGGLSASQFLRSDADDTATGLITFSDGLKIPNLERIFIGTGDQAQLYFDTANTNLDLSSGQFRLRNSSNEIIFLATQTASALYYSGTQLLATKLGAIEISLSTGPLLELNRADSSIVSGNLLAQIDFSGDDPASSSIGARISATARATWGVSDLRTSVEFSVVKAGATSLTEHLRIDNDIVRVLVDLEVDGAFNHDGSTFGAFSATPVVQPTGVATLDDVKSALDDLGLIQKA